MSSSPNCSPQTFALFPRFSSGVWAQDGRDVVPGRRISPALNIEEPDAEMDGLVEFESLGSSLDEEWDIGFFQS